MKFIGCTKFSLQERMLRVQNEILALLLHLSLLHRFPPRHVAPLLTAVLIAQLNGCKQ